MKATIRVLALLGLVLLILDAVAAGNVANNGGKLTAFGGSSAVLAIINLVFAALGALAVLPELKNATRLMGSLSNNVNQIAVRVNSTNKVYADDIVNIKEGQDKIWQLLNSLQSKLLRLKR